MSMMSDPINAVPVDMSLRTGLLWKSDLCYFDGPMLSYYAGLDGTHWIYQWLDQDDRYCRWMLMRVSKGFVEKLLASVDRGVFDTSWTYTENPPQRSDILDPFVYVLDCGNPSLGFRMWKLNVEDIPDWCFGELNASDENARAVPNGGTAESS